VIQLGYCVIIRTGENMKRRLIWKPVLIAEDPMGNGEDATTVMGKRKLEG
jgi:hypothetical protein